MQQDWVGHPLWQFLASVRLLIGLLIGFVAICVVGALIPQDLNPSELIARYGPVKVAWIRRLSFDDIFHSGYLALILLGLTVNVVACTSRRLLLKAMRGLRLIGYLTLHTALIVLFIGGTVSALGEKKGFLQVWEGSTSHRYFSWRDSDWRELPFDLALDRFEVERYEEYPSPTILSAIPGESYTQEFPADLKKTVKVGKASYWVTPLRYLPDFALDVQTGRAFSRSDEPRNPALLVQIQGPQGTERRWLFSRYPELEVRKDPRLALAFHWRPLKVKQFVSRVRILQAASSDGTGLSADAVRPSVDGAGSSADATGLSTDATGLSADAAGSSTYVASSFRVVKEATISVNRPLRYQGWRIYQTSYDPQEHRWSGFQVSWDPGVKIVAPGFLLLGIGVILLLGLGPLFGSRRDEEPTE